MKFPFMTVKKHEAALENIRKEMETQIIKTLEKERFEILCMMGTLYKANVDNSLESKYTEKNDSHERMLYMIRRINEIFPQNVDIINDAFTKDFLKRIFINAEQDSV